LAVQSEYLLYINYLIILEQQVPGCKLKKYPFTKPINKLNLNVPQPSDKVKPTLTLKTTQNRKPKRNLKQTAKTKTKQTNNKRIKFSSVRLSEVLASHRQTNVLHM